MTSLVIKFVPSTILSARSHSNASWILNRSPLHIQCPRTSKTPSPKPRYIKCQVEKQASIIWGSCLIPRQLPQFSLLAAYCFAVYLPERENFIFQLYLNLNLKLCSKNLINLHYNIVPRGSWTWKIPSSKKPSSRAFCQLANAMP